MKVLSIRHLSDRKILLKYTIIVFIILALMSFSWWITYNPVRDFSMNVPGMDNRPAKEGSSGEIVTIGAHFTRFGDFQGSSSENWPSFRGKNRDNILSGGPELSSDLDENPPNILWQVPLGEGHAGAAIFDGRVYVLDYDEDIRADMLRCFNLDSGDELWRRWYNVSIKRNHGMSRTVPAVTDSFIVTIGPRCHVMCVERLTGDFIWGLDLEKDFNTEVPFWYTGQCPLIDKGKVILAPGGSVLMMAVELKTGKILWQVPNPMQWKMSHASVMSMTFEGDSLYIYSAIGGVIGIFASGEKQGTIAWKTNAWNHPVIAPSPVPLDDGRIFLTAGYGAGSMLIRLEKKNGDIIPNILQKYPPRDGLACEQQSPVFYKGHLFGILPKDAGKQRNQFVCVDPVNCKEFVWTSGKTDRFGLGPFLISDDTFYLLNDDGTLYAISTNTQEYDFISKYKIFEGHDAWAPPALANGKMVLRDADVMYCIDLKK